MATKEISNQTVKVDVRTRLGWRYIKRTVYEVERVSQGLVGVAVINRERMPVKCKLTTKGRRASDAEIAAALWRGDLVWTKLWIEDGKQIWD